MAVSCQQSFTVMRSAGSGAICCEDSGVVNIRQVAQFRSACCIIFLPLITQYVFLEWLKIHSGPACTFSKCTKRMYFSVNKLFPGKMCGCLLSCTKSDNCILPPTRIVWVSLSQYGVSFANLLRRDNCLPSAVRQNSSPKARDCTRGSHSDSAAVSSLADGCPKEFAGNKWPCKWNCLPREWKIFAINRRQ